MGSGGLLTAVGVEAATSGREYLSSSLNAFAFELEPSPVLPRAGDIPPILLERDSLAFCLPRRVRRFFGTL